MYGYGFKIECGEYFEVTFSAFSTVKLPKWDQTAIQALKRTNWADNGSNFLTHDPR
jgi:hypothetical protein